MNRFKGLDLIGRVPEELWMEVCNIVQEAVTKTIPKKNPRRQNGCLLLEEALQIAEEGREVKGKEERERYIQLKAEFQRTSRRDKKAFFNEQCKEIEENNRMGNTRDLFKKIGDIKGTFHGRMGMIKHINGKDLTEVEEIKLLSGHRTGKDQFSFQSQRKAMPKNVQTITQLCSFQMLGRLCSKYFNLDFSSM